VITHNKILEMKEVNEYLLNQFEVELKTSISGKIPTSLEIRKVTSHPHIKLKARVILDISFEGILKQRGIAFDIYKKINKTMENFYLFEIKNYEHIHFMDENPLVNKYSKLYYFGNEWVSTTQHPKFSFTSFNTASRIQYEYLDTNQILLYKMSRTYRLATYIYKSLEDNDIYFAVYEITPYVERQMIRNQQFPDFNEFVDIEYIVITPVVVYILFYDQSNGKFIRGYTYFFNGPFIKGKTMNYITVDDKRLSLQLYEDKEMHWSFYKSLEEPMVYIDKNEKQPHVVFKIRDYYEIIGNLQDVSAIDDVDNPFTPEDFQIYEPLHFTHNQRILDDVTMHEFIDFTFYAENRVYYAINALQLNVFSIFRYCKEITFNK
jgi:hypothetical protein